MSKPPPAKPKKKDEPEVEYGPGEGPTDASVKDLLKEQAEMAKAQASEALAGKVKLLLPGTAPVNFGAIAFVCSLILIAVAIPLGAKGAENVPSLIPFMIPVLIFGVLWRSQLLGVLSIILALTALGAGYGSNAYYKQQEDHQKKLAETQKELELKRKADEEAAERKAAEEKKVKEAQAIKEAEANKKAAQAAAEEEEARRTKEQFFKEQEKRQKEQAEIERRKAEEAALIKKKAEEEERKKLEMAEAAKLKEEQEKKKLVLREEAKAVLAEKSLRVQELNAEVEKVEVKIRVAKTEMDSAQTVLDRETSPKPPSASELERANKAFKEAKQEWDKLTAQMPQLKAAVAKATAEKDKAAAALDALK